MMIWNTHTQAPLFPSQYSGLGSDLSLTYQGSCPAMIIWNTHTQAPLFPSQYSRLGSDLSLTYLGSCPAMMIWNTHTSPSLSFPVLKTRIRPQFNLPRFMSSYDDLEHTHTSPSLPFPILRVGIKSQLTYLGSCPAMMIWNTHTQAPLFPSQYSGLGSSLS